MTTAIAASALLALLVPRVWRHDPAARIVIEGAQPPAAAAEVAVPARTGSAVQIAPRRRTTGTRTATPRRRAATRAMPMASPGRGFSPPEPLAIADAPAFSPSFSPSGSAVFFHAGTDGAALLRADTTPQGDVLYVARVLSDGASNYHARISPDGRWVAFDSDRDGERAVYVVTRDGRDVRRVSGDGYAAVPSWSPDGRLLAFVRAEPDRPRVWNVWVADMASGAQRRVTGYSYGQPWGASWLPDGRRICYSHEDRIVVLDLISGHGVEYRSPVPRRLVRTPAVSPDGRRVIFQVYRDGAWLLDLADGSMRRVLDDPTAEEFAWSPDGRTVAFHSRRAGEWTLWKMAY